MAGGVDEVGGGVADRAPTIVTYLLAKSGGTQAARRGCYQRQAAGRRRGQGLTADQFV